METGKWLEEQKGRFRNGDGIEETAEASANGGLGGRVLGALARPVPDERSHGQSSV